MLKIEIVLRDDGSISMKFANENKDYNMHEVVGVLESAKQKLCYVVYANDKEPKDLEVEEHS